MAGLLWTFVRTDFKARYHGAASGFLWALLKPACMFLVLIAVFSFIFAGDQDYRMNLLVGLFLWDFFAEGTKVGMTSLHAKGFLLSKARFPSWIVVVASQSNALLTASIFAGVFLLFRCFTHHAPSALALLLFGVYLLHLAALIVGFSLGASVLFLRYRDLNQVWDVVVQAGFFLAPVIYPMRILPERLHFYLYLWPPTPVIQFSRAVLVDDRIPTLRAHLMLTGATVVVLVVGSLIFRRLAPRAAEYL